jgi:hypothetical protein
MGNYHKLINGLRKLLCLVTDFLIPHSETFPYILTGTHLVSRKLFFCAKLFVYYSFPIIADENWNKTLHLIFILH